MVEIQEAKVNDLIIVGDGMTRGVYPMADAIKALRNLRVRPENTERILAIWPAFIRMVNADSPQCRIDFQQKGIKRKTLYVRYSMFTKAQIRKIIAA
jgi:hypothetical protein